MGKKYSAVWLSDEDNSPSAQLIRAESKTMPEIEDNRINCDNRINDKPDDIVVIEKFVAFGLYPRSFEKTANGYKIEFK